MAHALEYVYGYHGCRKSVADAVLSGADVMLSSENDYDWLGTGIYFWEEAPVRAYEWAHRQHPDEPAVIGAKQAWALSELDGHIRVLVLASDV